MTMDITSFSKDTITEIVNFSQKQFIIWLQVIRDPIVIISNRDLTSSSAIFEALRFALFVSGSFLVLEIPIFHRYYSNVNFWDLSFIAAQLISSLFASVAIGCCLYASAKVVGGRGTFGRSLVTGLYLTGLWLFVLIADYVSLVGHTDITTAHQLPLNSPGTSSDTIVLILLVAIGSYIVGKTVPVISYIHSMGRVRASVATIGGMALYIVMLYALFYPFDELNPLSIK